MIQVFSLNPTFLDENYFRKDLGDFYIVNPDFDSAGHYFCSQ